MKRSFVAFALLCCFYSLPALAQPQQDTRRTSAAARGKVLVIGNLTWRDIDALSRDSTLFLLAVGMLEEHGPHLPIASD